MPENKPPVFILGLPRSASKWIMHNINQYTDICMIHELHLKRLWRIGNHRRIKRAGRYPDEDQRVRYLENLIRTGKMIGCYWHMEDTDYSLRVLSREEVVSVFKSATDSKTMLEGMMEAQRKHYQKQRWGARHPVHFAFIKQIFRWYPDARVLFLTRSMKEIALSWRKKKIKGNEPLFRRIFWSIMITGQVYINALLAHIFLMFWKKNPAVEVISYQNLVAQPEFVFQKISEHIYHQYNPVMAVSDVKYDSAYETD